MVEEPIAHQKHEGNGRRDDIEDGGGTEASMRL
jgi:hypothetical protein